MILIVALLGGFIAGLGRAWYWRKSYSAPELRCLWLAPAAFLPQCVAFYFPMVRRHVSDRFAAQALVTSQSLLLLVGALNWQEIALRWLTVGLGLNLLVITLNGGLMPISPVTVKRLVPTYSIRNERLGKRLGITKDRLLPESKTKLAFLADRWVLPKWIPLREAFSIGDFLIAIGIFYLLWHAGRPGQRSCTHKK
ncbi:MAG: DUF5317 domain-containing protein [Caldilineaceae bacterium]